MNITAQIGNGVPYRAPYQPSRRCRDRKEIEMLFAHLKRILRLDRLRLRGPSGAQFEFTLAAPSLRLRRGLGHTADPRALSFDRFFRFLTVQFSVDNFTAQK